MENDYMTHDIGKLLKLINDRLKTSFDASFKEKDLTLSQTRVLEFIHMRGTQTTQKEIEEYLEVSHPTVTGIISRLEKNGFLSCYFDPDDRRNKIVCNTEKARMLNAFMAEEKNRMEHMMTVGLSETEIGELFRMLQIIYGNIKQ